MSQRLQLTDERLGTELFALAEELDYPATPPLAVNVRRQLEAGEVRGRVRIPSRPRWQTVAIAIGVVLFALAGTLTFSPSAREAVADFIGIGGVRIGYGEKSPTPPPSSELDLGPRLSLEEAERRVDFAIKAPMMLGLDHPEVHVTEPPDSGMVSLLYPDAFEGAREPALLVTEFEADLDGGFFKKLVFEGAEVRYTTVRGHEGYWVTGAHFFYYFDEFGNQYEESIRLAANVLLWEEDGITYRIEGGFGEAQAQEIADSLANPEPVEL